MSKIKTWQLTIAAVVLAGIAWMVAGPVGSHPVELGETAPAFAVPRAPNGTIALSNYRGRVVVLNFWATWCPPCVDEAPSLEAFAQKMQPRGVVVLGVSVDEDPAALQKFITGFHLTYPIGRDPARALAARYGTFKFPETYIIDRSGRVAEKIIGETDWTDPRIIAFVGNLAGPGERASR